MVLPSTGNKISFSQIQTEMGGTNPIRISEYYTNAGNGYTSGISGLPSSGTKINMASFYSKSKSLLLIIGTNIYKYASQTIKHIDDIPYTTFSGISTNVFYLEYTIYVDNSTQTIRVACRKSTAKNKITQSCFTLNGSSLTYDTPTSQKLVDNDDHDTLFMDGQGNGFLSKTNTYSLYTTVAHYKLTCASGSMTVNTATNNPQGYPGSGTFTNCTVVAFPHVGKTLYFNRSFYMLNGYSTYSWPSVITSYISSDTYANNLTTVSDGVNSVLIIWGSVNNGYYVTFDLTNGSVYGYTYVTFNDTFTWTNTTEEDAIGNQLFSIDGAICYYRNLYMYYTNSVYSGYSFLDNVNNTGNAVSIGSIDTQTGMDLITAIDTTDGYVFLADWGHDNGGLFNFGNDSDIGYTKTNIYKIPSTFTGTSPTRYQLQVPIPTISTSGGNTVNTYTGYKAHIFTSSGTFTTATSLTVDYMIVGGGGAGGFSAAGGGGAGGVVINTSVTLAAGSYSVVVGAGGAAQTTQNGLAGSGQDSSFNGRTAIGGGGGMGQSYSYNNSLTNGLNGGSGGGGSRYTRGGSTTQYLYGGYGNNGGSGDMAGPGGGGGGAGGVGGDATSTLGGAGGPGITNNYATGVNQWYAAGGAGVGDPDSSKNYGGNGIGGNSGSAPTAGATNTGSGGGAGSYGGANVSAIGGSGIVIIRYAM